MSEVMNVGVMNVGQSLDFIVYIIKAKVKVKVKVRKLGQISWGAAAWSRRGWAEKSPRQSSTVCTHSTL